MLIFREAGLKSLFDYLKNFGFKNEVEVVMPGTNAKMNEMQALMGIQVLKYLDEIIQKRARITDIYRSRLKEVSGIRLAPALSPDIQYNYAYMPIEVDESEFGMSRDALYEKLKEWNIHTRRYFYPLVCDYPCYRSISVNSALTVARRVADRILTLPIYDSLELSDVEAICEYHNVSSTRSGWKTIERKIILQSILQTDKCHSFDIKVVTMSYYTEKELMQMGFKYIGDNILLSKDVLIYGSNNISIGDNVRIDAFCTLSSGQDGYISIGNHIHIATGVSLFGGGGIRMHDFTSISAKSTLYSASDDYSGEYLMGPNIDDEYTNVEMRPIVLEKYSAVGAHCLILPGVTLEEGSVLGAMSYAVNSLASWMIYAGIPARPLKKRTTSLIEKASKYETKYKDAKR